MRARIIFGIAILTTAGCPDFSSLQAGPEFQSVDMFHCETEKNALAEDCSNGLDDNADCLADCEDPQCQDSLTCVDKGAQFIGYGSRRAKDFMCSTLSGSQTSTDLKQSLMLSPACSGCSCLTTASCSSTLHWFSDMTNCTGNANELGNIKPTSGNTGSGCYPISPSSATYVHRLDAISVSCPVDTSQRGTPQSAWTTEARLCAQKGFCSTFSCMLNTGATCLGFVGDFKACPPQFPVKASWFQSATDNRVCACQCQGQSGSCSIAASQAQFQSSTTCMAGGSTASLLQTGTCIQPSLLPSPGAPGALLFSARPLCQASGSASTAIADLLAAGTVSINGPVTTCCTQ